MRAALIITGDEVLRGRIRDANVAPLALSLERAGARVGSVRLVADDRAAIASELTRLVGEGVELVVVSGGLGPTHDDVTMEAVARAAGVELRCDPAALEAVERASRGVRVSAEAAQFARHKQATLPVGSVMLDPVGTAPGCVLTVDSTVVVVLPGPPWELWAMWTGAMAREPVASLLATVRPARQRVLRVEGRPESYVVDALRHPDAPPLEGVELGICAREGELELTLTAAAAGPDRVDELERWLVAAMGAGLYSRDGESIDALLARRLGERGHTVAVAESCTGGGLGARLTAPPGASAHMLGGIVAYDNRVKRELLGVDPDILARHGAVSAECARAMAAGARARLGADWGLSTTGIAGPDGGTDVKPVGTVFIGVAGPSGVEGHAHRLRGDRDQIRARTVAAALHHLRRALEAQ